MFYTRKARRKLRMEVYSALGAATAVNAGIGVTAVVMAGKNRKNTKDLKERVEQVEMHISKEEEQLTKVTKAVRTIQDTCMEHGLLSR